MILNVMDNLYEAFHCEKWRGNRAVNAADGYKMDRDHWACSILPCHKRVKSKADGKSTFFSLSAHDWVTVEKNWLPMRPTPKKFSKCAMFHHGAGEHEDFGPTRICSGPDWYHSMMENQHVDDKMSQESIPELEDWMKRPDLFELIDDWNLDVKKKGTNDDLRDRIQEAIDRYEDEMKDHYLWEAMNMDFHGNVPMRQVDDPKLKSPRDENGADVVGGDSYWYCPVCEETHRDTDIRDIDYISTGFMGHLERRDLLREFLDAMHIIETKGPKWGKAKEDFTDNVLKDRGLLEAKDWLMRNMDWIRKAIAYEDDQDKMHSTNAPNVLIEDFNDDMLWDDTSQLMQEAPEYEAQPDDEHHLNSVGIADESTTHMDEGELRFWRAMTWKIKSEKEIGLKIYMKNRKEPWFTEEKKRYIRGLLCAKDPVIPCWRLQEDVAPDGSTFYWWKRSTTSWGWPTKLMMMAKRITKMHTPSLSLFD